MKRYGLLGGGLGHSYSPKIHGMLGDYSYELFARAEEDIPALLARHDLGGINVTIPYKKTVLAFCHTISDNARRIGCVNTILFNNGRLHGDNTDYDGFAATLDLMSQELSGKKIVILGRGATALTVEAVCLDRGAQTIYKAGRADLPLAETRGLDAQVLINCTPVGMYPHNAESLVRLRDFKNLEGVIDVVYNPHRTALLLEARELGIPYADGLPMLVGQAVRASELFTAQAVPSAKAAQILKSIRRETENIVLIGMPGSGKSTLGQKLAHTTGRKLIDIDEAVEAAVGMSIPDFFHQSGEAAFRAVEKQMVEKFGRENGLIIATGGGVIKDPDNYAPLAQNGRIYYLMRPLDVLATNGRPLSAGGRNLFALLAEREPLYRKFADVSLDNSVPARTTALILEDFHENSHH